MNAALFSFVRDLLGAAIGDQGPKQNPDLGKAPGDVDYNFTGNPSELVTQPYVTPSFGTRLFHPDVASAEASGNSAYALAPTLASRQAQARLAGTGTLLQPIAGSLPNTVPETASMLNTFGSEGNLNQNVYDWNKRQSGLIPAIASNDVNSDLTRSLFNRRGTAFQYAQQPVEQETQSNVGNRDLSNSIYALNRLPMEQKLRTEQDYNMLSQLTDVAPKEIALQSAILSGQLKRNPTNEELLNHLQALRGKQTRMDLMTADNMMSMMPQTLQTQRNIGTRNLFESAMVPPTPYPFGGIVHNGRVIFDPNQIAPGFVPAMQQLPAKLGTGMSNQVTLSNGQTVTLPNLPHSINPMTMEEDNGFIPATAGQIPSTRSARIGTTTGERKPNFTPKGTETSSTPSGKTYTMEERNDPDFYTKNPGEFWKDTMKIVKIAGEKGAPVAKKVGKELGLAGLYLLDKFNTFMTTPMVKEQQEEKK